MDERLRTVVGDFTEIVGGRYYTNEQIKSLCDLTCIAELLDADDRQKLAQCAYGNDFSFFNDALNLTNAYTLASFKNEPDHVLFYISNKKAVCTETAEIWKNKLEWVAFIKDSRYNYASFVEKAFYYYALGKTQLAKELFAHLAELNDLRGIKYSFALSVQEGDDKQAVYYLTLYKKLLNDLYDEQLPQVGERILQNVEEEYLKDALAKVSEKTLTFFNPKSFANMQFNFGGKYND